jgi:hypothetical protein
MAETVTNRGKFRFFTAFLAANDVRMGAILGTAVGVNDPDLNTVADLDAVAGVSILAERLTLAGETVTEDDVNNRAIYDAANTAFTAVPATTVQGVFIYNEGGGTDGTRDLIAVYTTGFPQPLDGGLNVNINNLIYGT